MSLIEPNCSNESDFRFNSEFTVLPSFLPSLRASFLTHFLPSFLTHFLPSSHTSFLPHTLPYALLSFLTHFLPSALPSVHASFLACFLPYALPSFRTHFLPFLRTSLCTSFLRHFLPSAHLQIMVDPKCYTIHICARRVERQYKIDNAINNEFITGWKLVKINVSEAKTLN